MTLRLISKLLAYNMDAHRADPVNLAAGAIGMIVNNVIMFTGMWGLLFANKPENQDLVAYYFSLNAIAMFGWGATNFFFGGYRWLGDLISQGTLEPLLATPRDPLVLIGPSRSSPFAFGDFVMGLVVIVALGIVFEPSLAARAFAASLISALGFAGLFVLASSLAFFVPRGSALAHLLIEVNLSLSVYPTGKLFTAGMGRALLFLTPAAACGVLPANAVERATPVAFAAALGAALLLGAIALFVFRRGVRHFRAVSLIGAQS